MWYCMVIIGMSVSLSAQQLPQFVVYMNPTATSVAYGGHANVETSLNQVPFLETVQPNISFLYAYIRNYIKKNFLYITGTVIVGMYSFLVFFLLNEHHAFHTAYYWSIWHTNETCMQLCMQPQEALKRQLIKEIAAYYVNPQNPTDTLWPLVHFISAIQKEEARLKRYIYITTLIKKTPLVRVLPLLQDQYAQEALARLQFVYHLFTTWSADLTWETLTYHTQEKI